MPDTRSSVRSEAFTLLELLCVMAIIGILAAILLPAISKVRHQAIRAQCVSQLRQTGVAFGNFAHDHDGQFPMAVPGRAGGTLELALGARRLEGQFYFSFRHLQALSNEIVTPKVLACPADIRAAAAGFPALNNSNVSYFVALSAEYNRPNSILAGDRNLTNDWTRPGSLVRLGGNFALRWTHELHQFKGNLLFSDGHVEEKNSTVLMARDFPLTAELALPTIQVTAPAVPQNSGAPVAFGPTPIKTASPGTSAMTESPYSPVAAAGIAQSNATTRVAIAATAAGTFASGHAAAPGERPARENNTGAAPSNSPTQVGGTLPPNLSDNAEPERADWTQWPGKTIQAIVASTSGLVWLIPLILLAVAALLVARKAARRRATRPD
jgi:prepilin-type N-terminal cleavage/methylation domain-containing protein/prepilin-type processing-associated H-X9-DG protein